MPQEAKEILCVHVAFGKYSVRQFSDGRLVAYRYGEEWKERDILGDNFILALVQDLAEARAKIERVAAAIEIG